MRPSATIDLDTPKREIDDALFELGNPNKARLEARRRVQVGQAQVALAEMTKGREEARATLWPEDEAESEG